MNIESSGISDDGFPYVKLKNDLTFYGSYPSKYQKLFFKFLVLPKVKSLLDSNCVRVAYDINFRYNGIKNRHGHLDFGAGNNVIEVGAFLGYFVMQASKIVGDSGKVIAIEAMDNNYRALVKNIESNKLKNVVLHNCAAWNKNTRISFFQEDKQRASAIEGVVNEVHKNEIAAYTIDSIVETNKLKTIDFIRIQVNGAELEVLEGMTNTLKMHPRLLIASIYKSTTAKSRYNSIIQILKEHNYKYSYIDGSIYAISSPVS